MNCYNFAAPNDEPIQRVHPHMDVDFRFADASSWTPADFNRELAEEMFHPFDLEYGSQMQVAVYARSPQEHVVLLSMHHTVTDMWSLAIIMSELGAYDISMVELFKYQTVNALAEFLADGGNGQSVQLSPGRAEKQKEAIERQQQLMRTAACRRAAQRRSDQIN
jgi:hypothetical protein